MRVLLIEPNMANHVLNAVTALSDSDLHAIKCLQTLRKV